MELFNSEGHLTIEALVEVEFIGEDLTPEQAAVVREHLAVCHDCRENYDAAITFADAFMEAYQAEGFVSLLSRPRQPGPSTDRCKWRLVQQFTSWGHHEQLFRVGGWLGRPRAMRWPARPDRR